MFGQIAFCTHSLCFTLSSIIEILQSLVPTLQDLMQPSSVNGANIAQAPPTQRLNLNRMGPLLCLAMSGPLHSRSRLLPFLLHCTHFSPAWAGSLDPSGGMG